MEQYPDAEPTKSTGSISADFKKSGEDPVGPIISPYPLTVPKVKGVILLLL